MKKQKVNHQIKQKRNNQEEEKKIRKYTSKEHIIELRNRLLICVVAIILAMCVSMYFAEYIYAFLTKPLINSLNLVNQNSIFGQSSISDQNYIHDHKFIFTKLTEGFMTYITLSFRVGIVLSFPIIASQLYFFIAPGLYKHERNTILPYIIIAPLLFLFGALLAYYIVMPIAWKFFLGFENKGFLMTNSNIKQYLPIVLEAKISEYLDLVTEMIITFGLAFQLPVVLVVLSKIGVLDKNMLRKYRKHAVIIIFIIAAIMTPPDVISQIILAIPLLLLYELSIVLCCYGDGSK